MYICLSLPTCSDVNSLTKKAGTDFYLLKYDKAVCFELRRSQKMPHFFEAKERYNFNKLKQVILGKKHTTEKNYFISGCVDIFS